MSVGEGSGRVGQGGCFDLSILDRPVKGNGHKEHLVSNDPRSGTLTWRVGNAPWGTARGLKRASEVLF